MQNFYFTDPLIGQGLPILSKNGAIAKQRLIDYISQLLLERNYIPLATPHIGGLDLFIKSGHYPHYQESMYPIISSGHDLGDFPQNKIEQWALKPMNCPFHIMAYDKLGIVSYKDLPVKFYEFGQVYRYEDSGALNGLLRLRSFTQDDGHVFCTIHQIKDIVGECIELVRIICDKFHLDVSVKFSKRGNEKDKYIGDKETWEVSEGILEILCSDYFANDFSTEIGGAAFYGPKIDFIAKDKLNREWQLGTIQLDFNLPARFDITYIDSDGKSSRPVLIHRAFLGSIERFLGILLENDLVIPYLQPFSMGLIWIGKNEAYFNEVEKKLKSCKVYPMSIRQPKNLKEAMSHLYSKGITDIVIVGKKEEDNNMVNFNKANYTTDAFYKVINDMFSI